MTTFRIPLTKIAMLKLSLQPQELSQDSIYGYITIDNVKTNVGEYNFIFVKATEEKNMEENEVNQFEVYVAWDDDETYFDITYSPNLFKNSRLATIDECKDYAGDFDEFIEATNDGSVVILADGEYQVTWETTNDPLFPEKYLYFVESDGTRHLIY